MNRYIIIIGCLFFLLQSCSNEIRDTFLEQDNPPISVYLENNPDYSEWYKLLEHANMTQSYSFSTVPLTFFVAKNDVVQKYLESQNLASVEDLSPADAEFLIKYHTIANQLYSLRDFKDGKLAASTATSDFLSCKLVYGTGEEGENAGVFLNSYAKVVAWDIMAVNGIMHSLDHVLDPIDETLFDYIKQRDEFSILTAAYEATGVDSLLKELIRSEVLSMENKLPLKMCRTMFVTPDNIFHEKGIDNLDKLKQHLGAGGDVTSESNALNLYCRYRVVDRDFTTTQFNMLLDGDLLNNPLDEKGCIVPTLAKNKILLLNNRGLDYILNDAVMDSDNRNIQVRNGFVHYVNDMLEIKEDPEPVLLFVEPGDFYYLDQFAIYRHSNYSFTTTAIDKKGLDDYMTWTSLPADKKSAVAYEVKSTGGNNYIDYYTFRFGDAFKIDLGTAGMFRMTTPPIPKGSYNVVVKYKTTKAVGGVMQSYFDEKKVGDQLNGWSLQIDGKRETSLGVMVFDKTEKHSFELRVVQGGVFILDAVVFTPIN